MALLTGSEVKSSPNSSAFTEKSILHPQRLLTLSTAEVSEMKCSACF